MLKKLQDFFIEALNLIIALIFFSFLGYFVVVNIVLSLFTDIKFQTNMISSASNIDLTYLILGILSSSFVAFSLRLKQKKIRLVSPFSLPKGEVFVYFITSFFLGYFFVNSIFADAPRNWKLIILFTSGLFFLLPQAVELFSSFNLSYVRNLVQKTRKAIFLDTKEHFSILIMLMKSYTKKAYYTSRNFFLAEIDWKKLPSIIIINFRSLINFLISIIKFVFPFLIYLVILLSFIAIVFASVRFTISKVNNYFAYQKYQRENLSIVKINPNTTTQAQKIELEGYHFGWESNEDYKLMSDYGKIN